MGTGHVEFLVLDSVGLEGGFPDDLAGRRFSEASGAVSGRFWAPEELSEAFAGPAAGQRQWEWLAERLAAGSEALLQVVVGHRPIRTVAYRGPQGSSSVEKQVAERLRSSLTASKRPVVYLHGHDHVMQHFRDDQLYHFGNGVGGMVLHELRPEGEAFRWGAAQHGFLVHELGLEDMTLHFVDHLGHVRHSVAVPFA